jgi:Na+/H+-dicarboxylate symporter
LYSSSTIPITLSSFEKNKIVNKRLGQFLLPTGTVVNVPGTAIYIAIASIFVVQTFHPKLMNFTTLILIW